VTLEELKAAVTEEWTVDIRDYDCTNDSRDGVSIENLTEEGMTLRPKRGWSSQGWGFATAAFSWEDPAGDLVEVEGTTVYHFYMPTSITSRSTPGKRECYKSYRFNKPRGY
jgi:hypothetical protein